MLAEQGRASIFIYGEAGHTVDVLDVGNMQLADFLNSYVGIKRNPQCPELGRLSFRSLQKTGSVTEECVQFVVNESGFPDLFAADFSFFNRMQVIMHSYYKIPDTAMMRKCRSCTSKGTGSEKLLWGYSAALSRS